MSATMIPLAVRQRLAADASLGGGNALQAAVEISPDIRAPFLYLDMPVRDSHGQRRGELSLRDLADVVQAWSAWYAGQGVTARDRVGIYLTGSADDLIHYLAITRLGAIAVLVNSELEITVAMSHFRRAGVRGVCTDDLRLEAIRQAADSGADQFWVSSVTRVTLPQASHIPAPYQHSDADPVLICHTSGTTGTPKLVIWTHGQMMAGIRHHLTRFPSHSASLVVSALPSSHAAAIGYAVLALLSGVPLALMSDRSGAAVAAAADRHRATVVVGFPSTFVELAILGPDCLASLDTVERWVSVGDASHRAHVAELVSRGRHWVGVNPVRGSMYIDGFGASELGWGGILGMVTVSGVDAPHRCVGTALPFADVQVLRPDGSQARPQEVGLLAVKGPVVTPGYWNDSDRTYRSMLNGYWLTGDVAYRDIAGRFYQLDRAADVIQTDAGPVYSVLTEEILLAHLPEIADCAVIGVAIDGQTRAIAVLEVRPGHTTGGLLARANEVLAGLGKPMLADLELAEPGTIPVGVTGKVLKRVLRERYASGPADRNPES